MFSRKPYTHVARLILPLLAISWNTYAVASEKNARHFDNAQDSLMSLYEDTIVKIYNEIPRQRTDDTRGKKNGEMLRLLDKVTSLPNVVSYPFDSLKKQISIIDCPENAFRIINWGVSYFKGNYEYFGYIIRNETDSPRVFKLTDKSDKIQQPETAATSWDNWYGALYYDLVKSGKDNDPFFVLLGWDGNDLFTNKKIIDILWFDEKGNPRFGKPVFDISGQKKTRVIFEYTEKSAMRLRWDPKIEMIVFDHLSPSSPVYQGHNEYYGSDFSYDGLTFNGNKWQLVEDIDVKNQKTSKRKKRN